MSDLVPVRPTIPAMSDGLINTVRAITSKALQRPQVQIKTDHVLHAGLYSRTIFVPAGVLITGVVIKIATLVIVQGDAVTLVDDGELRLSGYNVIPAAARRKQAIYAVSDMHLSMIFATNATTVEEAEREFTDDADTLQTRQEAPCPV